MNGHLTDLDDCAIRSSVTNKWHILSTEYSYKVLTYLIHQSQLTS